MNIKERYNRFKNNCYINGGINIYPQFYRDLNSILTYVNLSLQYEEVECTQRAVEDFYDGGDTDGEE